MKQQANSMRAFFDTVHWVIKKLYLPSSSCCQEQGDQNTLAIFQDRYFFFPPWIPKYQKLHNVHTCNQFISAEFFEGYQLISPKKETKATFSVQVLFCLFRIGRTAAFQILKAYRSSSHCITYRQSSHLSYAVQVLI